MPAIACVMHYSPDRQLSKSTPVEDDATDLVNEVDLGLGSQVAQQVHGAVQVEHCGHLATHTVIQAPGSVGVDEAVANPQA